MVLITGTNPGASSNRVVKALRAGRFPIMPAGCAQAWQQFAPFAWIGNVRDGMQWAFQNRATVCRRIAAGQEYCRERFSPERIGQQWADVFRGVGA